MLQTSTKVPASVVERRAADVMVLGSGSMAAAAAYTLARRGKKVLLLQDLGITSAAPGRNMLHPLHVPALDSQLVNLNAESGAYWRGIQSQVPSSKMLWPSRSLDLGLARSGSRSGDALTLLQDACKAASVKHGMLSVSELSVAFPAVKLPSGFGGLLQVNGGVLDSKPAEAGLVDLCVRTGVLVRDRLILRGWRDGGGHFSISASSQLLPKDISMFEAEQLLIAAEEHVPSVWQLFGLAANVQLGHATSGTCTAGSDATGLPLWRYLGGLPLRATGSPRSDDKAREAETKDRHDAWLQQVCWGFPEVRNSGRVKISSGPVSTVVNSLQDPEAASSDLNRSQLQSHVRTAQQLLPSLIGAVDLSRAAASPLLMTHDGFPVVGFHPGFEEGRVVVVATSSGRCSGPSTKLAAVAAASERDEMHRQQEGRPRPDSSGGSSSSGHRDDHSAGGGGAGRHADGRGASGKLVDGRVASTGSPHSGNTGSSNSNTSQPISNPAEILQLSTDGYQLSPLLAKMAVDLLCGQGIAEIDPSRVALARPGIEATALKLTVDTWGELVQLQSGAYGRPNVQQQYADKQQAQDEAEDMRVAKAE